MIYKEGDYTAFFKSKTNDTYISGTSEFVCDEIRDLSLIPAHDASAGSIAYVIGSASSWVMNSSGQWIECVLDGGGSGGGGGGGVTPSVVPKRDVNFIDNYDGSVVASYTASEFASMSSMPINPQHAGYTAQGWDWTLSDAKTYVQQNGKLDIVQTYRVNDGTTRIYVHLDTGRLSPTLGLCPNGSVDIDWGDGTAHSTVTGSSTSTIIDTPHTYAAPGDYVIKLGVTGSLGFVYTENPGSKLMWKGSGDVAENRVYQGAIRRVEIGSGITEIGNYMFINCFNLEHIMIPDTVTRIGTGAFQNCYGLTSIAIPPSVTSLGDSIFVNCYSLLRLELPSGITAVPFRVAHSCYGLRTVVLPSTIESISGSAFYNCYNIPNMNIPATVSSIGTDAFSGCYGLGAVKFRPSTPPTLSNSSVFSGLPADCVIYAPGSALTAYKGATNYPNSSTYSYVGL